MTGEGARCDSAREGKPDAAAEGLHRLGGGAMWLDGRYLAGLERAGLDSFAAFMASHGGQCLRALPDRENWRIEHAPYAPYPMFLKKHHVRSWRSWLRAKLGLGPGDTPGRVEARNARQLAAHGIPVMELVAFGEKMHADGLVESFVLTEELQGYRALDRFLSERFPDAAQPGRRDPALQRLIGEIAALVARLHGKGFNHRDLYCCHFFVREPSPGQFDVKLIDLQRVQSRRWFRWRWLVKDLAQLAWSATRGRVTCTQKMAFWRSYLGVTRLRAADKRMIRAILGKEQIIERRGRRP
jgi:heptose I phosphotransferase